MAATDVGTAEDAVPEGWLPELWRNPFTRVLGAPPSWDDLYDQLEFAPDYAESERKLPHTLRRYCALRMFDIVAPTQEHVDVAERIGMMIRQGYKARDPARGMHQKALMASAAAIQKLAHGVSVEDVEAEMPALTHSHPPAFALIGDPGTGKTTITWRTLSLIPQVVEQQLPYATIKQVVWLKVECPSMGGRKQQCIALLAAFDKVLGTRYAERFGAEGRRISGDQMMLFVQHLVTLHAVGLIVIDEIQHALQSTEGVKPLVNFLVTLVNMLGVPIMPIGTNEARSIVVGAFREARRASGLGQPNWSRLPKGERWDDWLKDVWPYQWTSEPTELTTQISEAIYDECQGIIDIAIKLLVLAQFRVISRGEVYGTAETLDVDLFRQVAKAEFGLIAPMMQALREGRDDLLGQWKDLEPLHQHVERLLSQETGRSMKELRHLRDLRQRIAAAEQTAKDAPWLTLKASLVQRGHAPEVVDRVVEVASQKVATDDMIGMVEMVNDLLAAEPTPRPDKVRKPVRNKPTPPADGVLAAARGAPDPLAALAEAGLLASPAEILAP
ncbi:MAG TPA: ATP-binding protein [Allosphingosinicella sp.]|jgi:hypothetical protein